MLGRHRVPFVVPERGEPGFDRLALLDCPEKCFGDFVLLRDPCRHLGALAHVVFEPAIRIGDRDAVIDIDCFAFASHGIVELGVAAGSDGRETESQTENQAGVHVHGASSFKMSSF